MIKYTNDDERNILRERERIYIQNFKKKVQFQKQHILVNPNTDKSNYCLNRTSPLYFLIKTFRINRTSL